MSHIADRPFKRNNGKKHHNLISQLYLMYIGVFNERYNDYCLSKQINYLANFFEYMFICIPFYMT